MKIPRHLNVNNKDILNTKESTGYCSKTPACGVKAKEKALTSSCHLSLGPDSYCPELFLSSSIEVFAPSLAETC